MSLLSLFKRECVRMARNPIYGFCMVVFPLLVLIFFTSLMGQGQPTDMPVGVVDLDNTATSRKMVRSLDAFQSTAVVAHYTSAADARRAMQRGEIYGFLYLPAGTTKALIEGRSVMSFYYSMTTLTSGALIFRDLKTITTLGMAGAAQTRLAAHGLREEQIMPILQPVTVSLHQLSNPWTDYNVYLSTMLVPGVIMLFIFLITPYSIGTEIKFGTARQWLWSAQGNMAKALVGKIMPQTLVFLSVMYAYMWYVFGYLGFPHPGGLLPLLLLGLLSVIAAQGFGVMAFSAIPSLRLSMSICSLWGVLSFSMVGSAYPVSSMDGALQALSWLFPLRHHFMVYQTAVLNNGHLLDALPHLLALTAFAILPLPLLPRLRKALLKFKYMP